jgi:hypothetical protein
LALAHASRIASGKQLITGVTLSAAARRAAFHAARMSSLRSNREVDLRISFLVEFELSQILF